MAALDRRLQTAPDISAVTFNAWSVDDGTMVEAFVKTVLNQLDGKALRRAL